VKLLQDPEVRAWLERQPAEIAADTLSSSLESDVSAWERRTRSRINGIDSSVPRIPSEFAAAAGRARADVVEHGYVTVFAIFAGVVLIGAAAETWFRRMIRKRTAGTQGSETFRRGIGGNDPEI
jgi:hypothetical protein